jgi:hypothetical protein
MLSEEKRIHKNFKNIMMKTIKKEKGIFQKFIDNVTENVKEGASFVGEKVAETSAKAYVASSELVSETSEKIHDFTEKQTLQKAEKIITARQKELKLKFGELTLTHYLTNDSLHKSFLSTKAIRQIVDEYLENEKHLKEISVELKKIEKKLK